MAIFQRVTVKEQIYEELKRRIQDSTYGPGERINIDNIAREMEVSNSPVREAVNMLVKDGLLQTSINAGPRVIELTPQDMAELNQAIYVLLVSGYQICKESELRDALMSELRARYQIQQQFLRQNQSEEYIKSAIRFDRAFLDLTENSRLIQMYDSLSDVFHISVAERYRNRLIAHEDNLAEHRKIIKCLYNRNEEELIKTLKLHYNQVK